MPILNRSKIRPDVLKICDDLNKEMTKGVFEFLNKEENKGFNFQAIYKKVMDLNELFFKREKSLIQLHNLLTDEERLFMTRLYRFSFEYAAIIDQKRNPVPDDVEIELIDVDGTPAEWQIIPGAVKNKILLYLHGGGWVIGSPNTARLLSIELGKVTNMRVLSVDYRLAPEHPYPAALEDCVSIYNWLLSSGNKSEDIIIAGDSAGGNLTLTTLIKLRNDGINLPAGAIPISPATDLSLSDDSYFVNGETDPILADLGIFSWITSYAAGANLRDPLISPLYADLSKLPPLLIQASTCEMLYSDSKRFFERAQEAGVDVKLQTWDNMVHVFQGFGLNNLTESKEALKNIGEFVQNL